MRAIEEGLCSVVVATRDEGAMLGATVASVLGESEYPSIEVVVVDDGSTDGSCEGLARDERVRVLRGRALGIPTARNLGAAHARGEYLVFLDAHCRVSPGWLDALIAVLAAPDVAIAAPGITSLGVPDRTGCGMTWVSPLLETAWIESDAGDRATPVPFAPGGCQAYRARTFDRVGRFDDGMTMWGFEDIEISLRAWLLGYRVVGAPSATVVHQFREQRDFEVPDIGVLFNYLRLVHLHFAPWRVEQAIAALGSYPSLDRALWRLAASDVLELRAELEAVRVRDDDWFFASFMPHLAQGAAATSRRAGVGGRLASPHEALRPDPGRRIRRPRTGVDVVLLH